LTQDKFTLAGDQLTGRGLTFDISALRFPEARGARLIEIGESIYLQGRESAMVSFDDHFDLHFAVEALRGLAMIVGPGLTGERYSRAAACLARLLQEQRRSS
jgi:hypothetical protein